MRRLFGTAALAGAMLLTVAARAPATPLGELINKNVQASANDYRRVAAMAAPAPELWIHVRSKAEAQLVQRNVAWLSGLRFAGRPMIIHPPLLVTTGPSGNQLRFFKIQDRQAAAALESSMAPFAAPLQLQDLSGPYQGLTWIASGRIELWLAPNLTRFGPAP
jgi:hypothetical protein